MKKFEVITISRGYFKKIVTAKDEEEAKQIVNDECCISGDLGEEIPDSGSIDNYDVRPAD